MVSKIIADIKCDVDMALAWAVSACNHSSFFPKQLVSVWFSPAVPTMLFNEPLVLKPVSTSNIVRENLDALHLARQECLKIDCDEKVIRS